MFVIIRSYNDKRLPYGTPRFIALSVAWDFWRMNVFETS